jgi:hypothetical protein
MEQPMPETIPEVINKVITLLQEGDHNMAFHLVELAIEKFGREPILLRALAETIMADGNAQQDEKLKTDCFLVASMEACSAVALLPGATEFSYFFAKILAYLKQYKRAVMECEMAVAVTNPVDPYCNFSLDWDGKQTESSETRIGKV